MAKVAILINAPINIKQSQFTYLPKGRWILEMINTTSAKLILQDPTTFEYSELRGSQVLNHIDGPVRVAVGEIISCGLVSVYAVKVKESPDGRDSSQG